jgi:hypothetical protein
MLKRMSGGDNETELKELMVLPSLRPSSVTDVATMIPVENRPSASRSSRSEKVNKASFSAVAL